MERWLDSKTVFEGKIFNVRLGNVEMDDGTIAQREVVEHPGGVCVVPVHGDSVIFVRQYRIALGRDVLELPAGKLEGDEEPEHRGRCELEEETGYTAGEMVSLGIIYASVGYTTEGIHMFMALDLNHVGQNLEFDERIETVEVKIADIRGLIDTNKIQDAKTIIGLEAVLRRLKQA